MQRQRKLLPKGFTQGMKQISGDFLWGVWDAMSPGAKPRSKGWRRDIQKKKRGR